VADSARIVPLAGPVPPSATVDAAGAAKAAP
jgi:hypothetical protein